MRRLLYVYRNRPLRELSGLTSRGWGPLGTSVAALRRQSLEAMGDELDRAEALGLLGVVLHPGCYTLGSEAEGLEFIADGLLELLRARRRGKTMILLEHTAGQGTALGATFEQLASIIAKMNDHRRVGVCLDTCHLLASGYDLCSPEGYASTFTQFGRLVGFDRLKAFHLNDSKKPLGSRVDRHEHIGQGCLGLEPFRRIVNDPLPICRCCSKRPRKTATPQRRSSWMPSMHRTSRRSAV